MRFTIKGLRDALWAAMLLLAASAAPAVAQVGTEMAFIEIVEGATSIPVGHAEFCKTHANECRPNGSLVGAVTLTQALWQQLLLVNASVNAAVAPVTDAQLYQTDEYWTYPNGYGDCEDFALLKRRELINAGWPGSALLMSVVKQADGEGHAVLLVRTDRGDFVLDNQVGSVDLWSDTPYKFVKRQSQADAGKWVDMIDNRDIVTATASIR